MSAYIEHVAEEAKTSGSSIEEQAKIADDNAFLYSLFRFDGPNHPICTLYYAIVQELHRSVGGRSMHRANLEEQLQDRVDTCRLFDSGGATEIDSRKLQNTGEAW